MAADKEFGPRTRIARLIRAIVERPNHYTKKALAELYVVSEDTIKGDIEAIRNGGFELITDERYRYYFVLDKPHKQLKHLLHFSEEDQLLLYQAIDTLPCTTERQQQLKNKLGSLYDFTRLGHAYLRKPYLSKVDLLEQARKEKRQAILVGYHSSNSNTISDRVVEPFHVSPSEDTVQTFDVDKGLVNHFRISRFTRVRLLETAWQHEGHHIIRRTDPFRIVGNEQVHVRVRLKVGAYNELTERFPLTKGHIVEDAMEGMYEFQCMVNSQFFGLSNFILGYYHQGIVVLEPEDLVLHLREEINKMKF
ncbi:MAG: helix-turn-helix transcriptional regulator [Saprospiraceae bacterium]